MPEGLWIAISVVVALVVITALVAGLVRYRRHRISLSAGQRTRDRSGGYTTASGITFSQTVDTTGLPAVGDDATVARDAPKLPIADAHLPEPDAALPLQPTAPAAPTAPSIEAIAPAEGRLVRLRGQLAKPQNALGRSVLGLLGGGDLDAGSWGEVEDTLLIAGRLHTKTGLMDELGTVKRVVTRRAAVDEVLLVLDATIGQNGLAQVRVFADVVDITGAVLTKLDGTAKGGIVFRVQQELGVPVKLVGLGEGPDDLAPFEPAAFVDALLG